MNTLRNNPARPASGFALLLCGSVLLAGCATDNKGSAGRYDQPSLRARTAASAPAVAVVSEDKDKDNARQEIDRIKMALGNGRMLRVPAAKPPAADDPAGVVTLTFENGDVREIVKNLLGDLLNESFVIDPAVTGTVTIRTVRGIRRSDVIPTLEMLLRSVKAVLVRDGAYWRVLPEAGANLGTSAPKIQLRPGAGNSVVILPVKHIGAKELERVMLPFAKAGTPPAIRVDELRNLLFITGTEAEISNLLEIAEMFDVNLLAGMSFLLYPLESSDVKSVVADWDKIFPGNTNPFAGLLRVVPIERMNALLLISPQRDVITDARQWLERLDKGGSDSGGGARLYVYYLQYTQAEKLQAVLQQALSGRANPATQATVAPGQTSSTLNAPIAPVAGQPIITPGNSLNTTPTTTQPAAQRPANAAFPGAAGNQAIGLARNATVIADKDRNALLIVATPSEYNAIEAAIKKLDTPPKMVAIEVQIAQVALDGAFQFGISGMFSGKPESPANRLTSEGGVGYLNPAVDGKIVPGFSYTWQGAAAKAILSTLQSTGQSRTLASPTLMTLDNQKVSFSNGTQISVQTQTTVATTTTAAQNSYQYIPTGLTINITPRVSGNNVFLEIQQENSTAGTIRGDNPNPDITKNSQQSTVMVSNGDTMLLSGLFIESGSRSTSGFPVLSTIPIIGGAFGSQTWNSNRSELVMLVTPRIMSTVEETRGAVDELRRRMEGIERILPVVGTQKLPTAAEDRRALEQGTDRKGLLGEFNHSLKVAPPAVTP